MSHLGKEEFKLVIIRNVFNSNKWGWDYKEVIDKTNILLNILSIGQTHREKNGYNLNTESKISKGPAFL